MGVQFFPANFLSDCSKIIYGYCQPADYWKTFYAGSQPNRFNDAISFKITYELAEFEIYDFFFTCKQHQIIEI